MVKTNVENTGHDSTNIVKTRPTGLLNIPNLSEPSGSTFDTRIKAVKSWFNELPLGDATECGQQIGHALSEINRLNISISHRIALLEIFTDRILEITQSLSRLYTNHNLPLNFKTQKTAELNIFLYSELAVGYKIIIEQSWDKKLSFFNTKTMVSNLYRAMYYLQRVLCTSYEIYREPPANVWTHIHQLYLYAEDNNLTKMAPKDIGKNSPIYKTTVGNLYQQIILLGLLCPYRLRQVDVKKVSDALKDWSKHCKMLSADEFSVDGGYVLIKLNSDYAPSFYFADENINHVYSRALDCQSMVNHITDQLTAMTADKSGNTNFRELPLDVIKLLVATWSGKSKRSFTRKVLGKTVSVSLGMGATHYMINNIQQDNRQLMDKGLFAALVNFKSPGTQPEFAEDRASYSEFETSTLQLQPDPISSTPNYPANGSVNADVWDADYNSKVLGQTFNKQPESVETTQPQASSNKSSIPLYFRSSNLNESADGYCIASAMEGSANSTKAKIGELVGINDQSKDFRNSMAIGVIRRIRNLDDNGVEIGVQKLAPIADIVTTCHVHQKDFHPKFIRGLIIPAVKSQQLPCTVLLNTKYKIGDELIVDKLGYQIQIKLKKLVENTSAYGRFEFGVVKVLGTSENTIVQETSEPMTQASSWTLI